MKAKTGLLKNYLFLTVLFIVWLSVKCTAQNFTRILTGPVVTTIGDSRSVNWVDVNNDGLVDLFISNGPSGGQNNMLYINNGGGNFTAVTGDPIISDHAPSDGATFADSDNDNDADGFVVNWYDVDNMYYPANGNGTFTNNSTVNIANDAGFSETASWGDYDKDGLVDLYVTNSSGTKKNFLYHNDGSHTFTKILTGLVVNDTFESRSVNWTDIDNDHDLDLFVTNESLQNENIYRNDGGGTFTTITTGDLVNNGGSTMSSSWGDYDNDGDLDVFLANDLGDNSLFRNDGGMNFTKIINDTVANSNGWSFSSAWSDTDNDGDLDLFVTNAFHGFVKHLNFMYLNNGNGTFSRISNTAPATDSSWSYGCAFGDYDNDGFEDLAVATVRFSNIDQPDLLYHNDGNANHWITITLKGTVTNHSAIGTRIYIKAVINGNPVWQMREISAQTAYCSQNDMRAHFGLGNATSIDSIKIEWLNGAVEHYTAISADQFIVITELQGMSAIHETINEKKTELNIYPNPSTGKITISVDGYKMQPGDVISIKKIKGEITQKIKLTHAADKYELHVASPGTYFISVVSKNKSWTGKFILNKL